MAEAFLHGYTGFVGTASTGGSRGIYRIRLNAATGERFMCWIQCPCIMRGI